MLMHATMNHDGHQTAPQAGTTPATPVPVAVASVSDYKCAHCGFPLQAGYAFCPSCGMNLRSAKCSACGQKVDSSWAACAYCGSPLGEVREHAAHH
jgi:predicted amidophosphoribosyltransferase